MDTPAPIADNLATAPLYREVQWRITRALAAGEWKPGEAIPSESRLARQFNVSIGTIRRAILLHQLCVELAGFHRVGKGTLGHDRDALDDARGGIRQRQALVPSIPLG